MASAKPEGSKFFYRSVDELPEQIQTKITGTIPKWISGVLLRNGPGKFEVQDMAYRHVFDGLALLQQFVIEDGNVTYFNKFLRSQTYLRNMKAGMIVQGEFGTPALPDPCKNIFARWFSYFFPKEYTDNASVNFCCIKGKIYAMTEVPIATEINVSTLDTLSRLKLSDGFQDALKQVFHATAHPHEDEDGSVYNLTLAYDKKIGLSYVITMIPPPTANEKQNEKPLDNAKAVAAISASNHHAYSHSFGMSEKYFIFIQQPLTVNLWKLAAARVKGWSIMETFSWDQANPECIFHVISRESGEVVSTLRADPFFFFHVANSYDLDGEVVIDICCYNDSRIFHAHYLEERRKTGGHDKENNKVFTSQLRRYHLLVNDGRESSPSPRVLPKQPSGFDFEVLCDTSVELPRINESYSRRRHRFVYGACGLDNIIDGLIMCRLVKVDVQKKLTVTWSEDGCLVSEPVFIVAPDSHDEDEGVVMSSVYDTKNEKSFLLVLDGRSFTEIARAEVSLRFAPSFHGRFFAGAE